VPNVTVPSPAVPSDPPVGALWVDSDNPPRGWRLTGNAAAPVTPPEPEFYGETEISLRLEGPDLIVTAYQSWSLDVRDLVPEEFHDEPEWADLVYRESSEWLEHRLRDRYTRSLMCATEHMEATLTKNALAEFYATIAEIRARHARIAAAQPRKVSA
jgi:hypothetical protein